MSRYDGLIIPRSYSEYLNKTDSATLSQMLQHLTGLWSHVVAAGDNKPVTSDAVDNALTDYDTSTEVTEKIGNALAEYKYYSIKADNAPALTTLNWLHYYAQLPIPNDVNEILMCSIYGFTQTEKGLRYQLAIGQDKKSLYLAKINKNDTLLEDEKIGYAILYR